jgi:hypothetical protein
MPRQSLVNLRKAIESAPEMTAEHRAEMLALAETLANELAAVEGRGEASEDAVGTEDLRGAIAAAEHVVRRRTAGGESREDHDLGERLSELEEKVEMVAVGHPVIANILTALARLG